MLTRVTRQKSMKALNDFEEADRQLKKRQFSETQTYFPSDCGASKILESGKSTGSDGLEVFPLRKIVKALESENSSADKEISDQTEQADDTDEQNLLSKKTMFIMDNKGFCKQFEFTKQKVYNPKPNKSLSKLVYDCLITPDKKYCFVIGNEHPVNLDQKRYTIEPTTKNFNFLDKKVGVFHSICCTQNSQTIFTGDIKGQQLEWSITKFNLIRNWGEVHNGVIQTLLITDNSRKQLSFDSNRNFKEWSIGEKNLIKNHGVLTIDDLKYDYGMNLSSGQQNLLVHMEKSLSIIQWSIPQKKIEFTHKLDNSYEKVDMVLLCEKHKSFFVISNGKKNLSEWSQGKKKLIKNYGVVCGKWQVACIEVIQNAKYLIIGGVKGGVRQLDIKRQMFVNGYLPGSVLSNTIFKFL